ncbi:MAG: transcriptional repressor NrdR [candidate division Zixibacteria bacterium]|nr:transcriptional repressor NrdR [candidate division Zixibacteria bacterium]
MKCPFCGFEEDRVVDSRSVREGRGVRRRRECLRCNERFTTYEYVEKVELMVVKNDGRQEPFDRGKLIEGIRLACKKRPIGTKKIEAMVDEVQKRLYALSKGEVTSKMIGETVMDILRETDEVAYVRFASVYRKFQDKTGFVEELKRMLGPDGAL